jgi:hypothetical protein
MSREAESEQLPEPCIQVGLIATPALPEQTTTQLADELAARLLQRYPEVCWEVPCIRELLVSPPAKLTELVDAARSRLLEEDWELVVCVTDLPLRLGRRPLLTHTSPTHGVALVSLPALGPWRVGSRLLDTLADAVAVLLGDTPSERSESRRSTVERRLVELAAEEDETGEGVALVARVITGNMQLLLGMIRANRPWRLVSRLSRALLAALAAASYALVAADVWDIAASLSDLRLLLLTAGSIGAAVFTLIKAHGLWERADDPRVREQVLLFNIVTLITVVFGVASLYLVVFLVTLAVAVILIDPSMFTSMVGEPVDASEYLRLAWLASSVATVGGALGAVLESDETVREAAYAHRIED